MLKVPNLNLISNDFVASLLGRMTLAEKVGQMSQVCGNEGHISANLSEAIKNSEVGSVINEVCPDTVNEMQLIARHQSRLGIPLLIGRDVIHGFKTIFPIPLGQAATWSPQLVEAGARIAAMEASTVGVNWTFAPMIDISRDPRWGRIAESLGEDPYLSSVLGSAMIAGFQTQDLSQANAIASCAKHFAGYGAVESGRDYSTTNIPENELRNVYLPPFKVAADAGAASFMTSFSDLNGVPVTGNEWLVKHILREEWQYEGMVVSDWESIVQLSVHGFTENDKESAFEAVNATVDMEMASRTYKENLATLIDENRISLSDIDAAVTRILTLKYKLGLFNESPPVAENLTATLPADHLQAAKECALKSCVLLKNEGNTLPLNINTLNHIAVIGPLADDGYEQLGTWVFDGEERHSVTCLQGIQELIGDKAEIHFAKALATTRSNDNCNFEKAVEIAEKADVAILFLGEESILSGEAHCRAELDLPGKQNELIEAVRKTQTPIILVILAGRPLTIESILPKVDAVLYAWHPGSMGGAAIAELLFGIECPSGKLPVTFVRKVGQIPLYYGQKHSGKPASSNTFIHMNDVPVRAAQTSLGMAATHLDTYFTPLFPFGFGLSYSRFEYHQISAEPAVARLGQDLTFAADVINIGNVDAEEIVQLYVRDMVASVTRPVRELKGFERVFLNAGQTKRVKFRLTSEELGFYDRNMKFRIESGQFQAWIGGSSEAKLQTEFEIINA